MIKGFEEKPFTPRPKTVNKAKDAFQDSTQSIGESGVRSIQQEAPSGVEPDIVEAVRRITPQLYQPTHKDKTLQVSSQIHAPHLIARGEEHLVFAFEEPRHQGLVFKVNFFKMKGALQAAQRGQAWQRQEKDFIQREAAEYEHNIRQLRQYFGHAAIPPQRIYVDEVPVSKELVEKLYRVTLPEGIQVPDTLPARIVLQRKMNLPTGDAIVSLTSPYPENQVHDNTDVDEAKMLYAQTHEALMDQGDAKPLSDQQLRMVLKMYPGLQMVALQLRKDPSFKDTLRQTVKTMIAYTMETGMIMDLVGKNNVALLKEEKNWVLKLMDPLPPRDWRVDDLALAVQELKKTGALTRRRANDVKNILNTIRVINALAILAGVVERVRVKSIEEIPAHTWLQEILGEHRSDLAA